jgi:hypothetical protein
MMVVQLRGLVAVLLRSSIFTKRDSLWEQISPGLQGRVKAAMLNAMANEATAQVRHKLIDTTCELAGYIFNRAEKEKEGSALGTWPEMLQFLFQAVQHAQPAHRDTGLRIFTRLSPFLAALTKPPHLATVKQVFARGLNDTDLQVRMSALSALISFIELHFDDETKKETQTAIPKMAEIITTCLKLQREEEARTAVGFFVELAEADPLFFRPQIGPLCHLMSNMVTSADLEEVTRQYALEFLVTLCEQKPGMMAKVPNFFPQLIKICVQLLFEVEQDSDWLRRNDDALDVSNADVAAESLDRLCLCLTGKTMMPILHQMLPALLQSQDWKQRHAGLQVICVMGEGCKEEVADDLANVLAMLVPFFRDPHPRCRFESFNALGQLCTDFGPALQEEHHAVVLPVMLEQLEKETIPK